MRFAGSVVCVFVVATGGCATHSTPPLRVPAAAAMTPSEVSGVWDALSRTTIGAGVGAGDTRIEKQEWHLTQAGSAISGYYIAALTFVSGDGRPYVCNRQPRFSATQRFNVAGRVNAGQIEIEEKEQGAAEEGNRCDPGQKQLARYSGRLDGDVLTLMSGAQRQTLYRIRPGQTEVVLANASGPLPTDEPISEDPRFPEHNAPSPASSVASLPPADVSGMWIWEHSGVVPGGDEKQEREEWHVTQDGAKISGYYDRVVHQVSTDGQAYRCSMALDFQIVTRYQFRGEVDGSKVMIYESSFEVMNPNACDNGKRRLDAYEGQAASDELRLVWGVGGQVLRRPRPDVPTQRF
ncbi:MAG TPA: hypothetical protein VH853_22275 [Polyangia bacterium]|jgi:hypothetical protein|nr:hypothetical protein [Polyangia bacterium]